MDRMRIAVDARPLEERPTGVGRYLEGLLTAWLAERADDSFVLLSPRPVTVPPSLEGRVALAPSPALPGTLWLQTAAGLAARRAGADAFFGCLGIVPLAGGPPSVATVHDVTPLLFPEWHSLKNRLGFAPFIGGSVRTARRIAAVSEHSRRDLVARFPEAAAKTSVVYNGVDSAPAPPGGPVPNEGRPYVLSLGTIEPRKNLPRLVEAMESIWDRRPDFPDLVLAGTEGWGLPGLGERLRASRHAARIRPAGYLAGAERSRWMAGARVFAYPSLYEGFGLPPLEAMALGTPVVASSASSLPEVVGDAGLLPDPENTAAIAAALEHAHDDEAFRLWAAAKGPARGRDVHLDGGRAKDARPLRGGARVTRPRVLVDARKAGDFGIGSYIRGLLGGLVRQERWDLCATVHPGDDVLLPPGVAPIACDAAPLHRRRALRRPGRHRAPETGRVPRAALRRARAAAGRDGRDDPRPHAPEPPRARRALEARVREVDGRAGAAPLRTRDHRLGGDERGDFSLSDPSRAARSS